MTESPPPPVDIAVVPHTHWDREWYEPFQRFRLRLVALLDDVIPRLESEPDFCFTLDGQTAAIDDYLEVRPEMEPRVATLVAEGRLAAGPWRILLDEFLCSGENIVRNLEMGLARAEQLGGTMPVGYLPDMFGHCAQMPQILHRAELDHACLWRGVPTAVDRHAFHWVAPDGSRVRTEYLPGGYGNGADLFGADDAASRMAVFRQRMAPWFVGEPMLAMYGTDHSAPLPTLVDDVRALDTDRVRVGLRTLTDYVAARDPNQVGLPVVAGELRSHARANILPGVLSVRSHLKRAMNAAERMVERYAEPLAALWAPMPVQRFLDMAWQRLVDCSCHDSVTGCGVDETAQQVAARLAEAEQLGRAVRDQVLGALARRAPSGGWVVANPTPQRRTDLVEVEVAAPEPDGAVGIVDADGTRRPVQEIGRSPRTLAVETHDDVTLLDVFHRIHRRELFGRQVQRMRIADRELVFELGRLPGDEPFDPVLAEERVRAAVAEAPGRWTLRLVDEDRRRLIAAVDVPPLGWTSVRPTDGPVATHPDPVTSTDAHTLSNGRVTVTVEQTGTLRLTTPDGVDLTGVGRLVDGGDRGDTYNYAPPARDRLIDTPVEVETTRLESGPLRGRIEVVRRYTVPVGLEPDLDARSASSATLTATTLVELRADEPYVRLRIDTDNPASDHRLRLHVPTAEPTSTSAAEGQFAVTTRTNQTEGGWGEAPLPTYPASAFVDAGGVSVLLTQPSEYELCDARDLAVTLLRAVGQISRNIHPLRDEPAGPEIATPQAQQPTGATCDLAILPHGGDWSTAGTLEAVERFRHPLATAPGTAPAGSPPAGPAPAGSAPAGAAAAVAGTDAADRAAGLQVDGDGVVFSSLRRRGELLELRLVAQTDRPTTARVRGDVAYAQHANLLGRAGAELPVDNGAVELPLGPWEIATVQLR